MKPKTHEFKGKKVIAVPETNVCIGCVFNPATYICEMDNEYHDEVQLKHGMPICYEENIIFQLAPDENTEG